MEQPHKTKIFQSPDMEMPKNQQQQLYYRTDSQTINKARTMLSENYRTLSIYNEGNHEAKISISEEIRDPKLEFKAKSE